ncbi:MAG: DegV family protein, partial [Clostridium sp.]
MQKIALITDSACDLTLETMEKNNIGLFPLRIIYSHAEFEDKINITSEEVYESLDKEIPSTSLPSPKTCEKVLSQI